MKKFLGITLTAIMALGFVGNVFAEEASVLVETQTAITETTAEETKTAEEVQIEVQEVEEQTTKIIVKFNGVEMNFEDQGPVIKDNRTLLPFRAILEKMGATVTWDEVNRTVRAIKGTTGMVFEIGNTVAIIGQERVDMDVPAQIINGRTMIPVRFVAENLGYNVEFDNSTEGVYVITIDEIIAPVETETTSN